MAVNVSSDGNVFKAGTPQPLFTNPNVIGSRFEVSSDGLRFLIGVSTQPAAEVDAARSSPLTVLVNWQST